MAIKLHVFLFDILFKNQGFNLYIKDISWKEDLELLQEEALVCECGQFRGNCEKA